MFGFFAVGVLFSGLWLWLGSRPAINDFQMLIAADYSFLFSETNYYKIKFLFILTGLFSIFLFQSGLPRTGYLFIGIIVVAFFVIMSYKNLHDKYHSPIDSEHKNYNTLLNIIETGNYQGLDKLLKQEHINLTPSATDYIKAQMQTNKGQHAPYLERTVKRLRQGDATLNSYNPETLYALEQAYDGQIVSEPAKKFEKLYLWTKWLWIPLPFAVALSFLFGCLLWREKKLGKKLADMA